MQKSKHQLVPALAAFMGAAAGFALRRWQLSAAFDQNGRAAAGHISSLLLALICAAVTVTLALFARRLAERSGYEETFSSGAPECAVSLAAAALFLVESALSLLENHAGIARLTGALGIVSGFCIAIVSIQRYQGKVPGLAVHAVPCLYIAFRLVFAFKAWSVDPVVQDYCYRLFASIAAMLSTYHLCGFTMERGQRRLSAFWCLAGVVFSAVAFADAGLVSRLQFAAAGLWCAANGWQLLEN